MQSNSREEILNRIAAVRPKRIAAIDIQPSENEKIYKPILPDAISCFKSELEAINGQCILCEDESDQFLKIIDFLKSKDLPTIFCRDSNIIKQLSKAGISTTNNPADFENMQAGITTCEFLVARTGSVIVSSAGESGRQMNVFPPIHRYCQSISTG